jgi:Mu-like prophage I protein
MTEKTMKWQKLAYAGAFAGHPGGNFEMTPQTFSEIEKNFKREGLDVVFDFEHASELSVADSPAKGRGEAIASGWIKDVQARSDGLYGLVAWTDRAHSMIKNQEVKYISPAIRFGAKDKVTGEPIGAKLSSAALCQKPFLSSLPPALASDQDSTAFLCSEISKEELAAVQDTRSTGYAMSPEEYLPQFRKILSMDELASADSMIDKIERLEELCEMAEGNPSATVEGVNLGKYITPLRDYMRMPANTTLSDLLNAAAEMIEDSQGVEMSDIPSVATQEPTTQPAPVITTKETEPVMETITLSEHTVKLSEAVSVAVKNAVSPLELQIKDLEAKALKAMSDQAEEAAKVVALTEQIAKRDASVAAERVEAAFSAYKETKKLSDDDKEAMAITLSTKPELFEKLYPKITPGNALLLRTVTASDTSGISKAGSLKTVPDLSKILTEIKAKHPNETYDKQFDMALAEQNTLMSA